jgi:hypothetical protein
MQFHGLTNLPTSAASYPWVKGPNKQMQIVAAKMLSLFLNRCIFLVFLSRIESFCDQLRGRRTVDFGSHGHCTAPPYLLNTYTLQDYCPAGDGHWKVRFLRQILRARGARAWHGTPHRYEEGKFEITMRNGKSWVLNNLAQAHTDASGAAT